MIHGDGQRCCAFGLPQRLLDWKYQSVRVVLNSLAPVKVTVNMSSQSETWFSTEGFLQSNPILCVMLTAAKDS